MNYWTIIPWLQINGKPAPYGVFNERWIRATAWIMMLVGFFAFVIVFTTKDFVYLYPVVIAFLIQFLLSVVWWPQVAPFSILWERFVRKQKPDYVWAIQKRFAWSLWLAMAITMTVVTIWFWLTWFIPFAICITCLFLMWMESALGICVGCKIYYWLIRYWVLKEPIHRPACPWWACAINFKKTT